MTDGEELEAIARTKRSELGAEEYVPASDPGARSAFLEGRVLFDVTNDGRRFEQLFRANEDLRNLALRTNWVGWWGEEYIDRWGGTSIPITAHKTAYDRRFFDALRIAGLDAKDSLEPAVLRRLAFHAIGHIAIRYWLREPIDEWAASIDLVVGTCGIRGAVSIDLTEGDLMAILGGPLAVSLSLGVVPKKAIRLASEDKHPGSDYFGIRALVKALRGGKDDRRYQLEVQERCREILQQPQTWAAITEAARTLALNHRLSGRRCEEEFARNQAPQRPMVKEGES